MICLIGNSGLSHHGIDGQTAKVRLYLKKIKDEGFDVCFIELEHFTRHPISVLSRIKKAIKVCDRIILISAERGCKLLIPFINRINKKYNKPFVLPLVGSSVLHYSIDKLSDRDKNDFLVNGQYGLCKKRRKLMFQLSRITHILPETDLLSKVFSSFYEIDNVHTLSNFRESSQVSCAAKKETPYLRTVFLSRVMEKKGIFDLIDVVNDINNNSKNHIKLDIYGPHFFTKDQEMTFNSLLNDNVKYLKTIDSSDVVATIANYDLFVFPTKFPSEGVPGVIVESLLAGTPVLTSNFPQAPLILVDNHDSLFFEMYNKVSLKKQLLLIADNKTLLSKLKKGALQSGEKYRYDNVRKIFLKYVCGKSCVED